MDDRNRTQSQSRTEQVRGWGPAVQRQAVLSSQPMPADIAVGDAEHGDRQALSRVFMNHVFGWMTAGLALSGLVAWLVMSNQAAWDLASGLFLPLIIGELVLVLALSAMLPKLSATAAASLFLVYAGMNGLTLGVVVALYTASSVARVFFITAGTFGAMAAIGATTKKDLTSMGSFLMMGVIAIVIAIVVNMFLQSSALDWAISVLGALAFAGLTAYDVQKFKKLGYLGFSTRRQASQMAISGALNLYLDFINMFLFLLRLFGDRR